MTNTLATKVSMYMPVAAKHPIAALHQTVAAEVSPCTLLPSLKIIPAPKNPTPVTTWAVIRLTSTPLALSAIEMDNNTNTAAPMATNIFVRKPAVLWCHCRSKPMVNPAKRAVPKRRENSKTVIRYFLYGITKKGIIPKTR